MKSGKTQTFVISIEMGIQLIQPNRRRPLADDVNKQKDFNLASFHNASFHFRGHPLADYVNKQKDSNLASFHYASFSG